MILATRRDFRLLFAGQALSQAGDRIMQLALLWWLLAKTGSAFDMGLMMAASTLPVVLLGPLAGSVVDRADRRRVIVACDFARGGIVLAAAWALHAGTFAPHHAPALAAALALFTAFFNPALVCAIPLAVTEEEIPEAQACEQLTRDMAGLVGPAAGGVLVAAVGVPGAVLVNGISFLAAGTLSLFLRLRKPAAPAGASLLSDLAAGIRFVRGEPGLARLLASFGLLNLLSGPVLFLLPALVAKRFPGGTLALGLLEASLAAGAVFMAIRLAARGDTGRMPNLPLPVAVSGAAFLELSLAPGLLPAGAALFAVGTTVAAVNVGMTVHFQRVVPEGMKGRFFALVETVAFAAFPVSFLAFGPLADRIGAEAVFAVSGALILCAAPLFRARSARMAKEPATARRSDP